MFIYHIALPQVWERFKDRPSYQPDSLTTEGFIHCSYPNQLPDVLKRYYYGRVERVLILKIDTDKLLSKLVKEPSTNDEIYPHIYGRLNHSAVVDVEERFLRREDDLNTPL
ncbi:MAG TPA: DUF952 domain-containing protein [Pyrinomonadaceae bacterium]|nr:DUF952 domain-containing protein [Pyrinomonadaceae bacterium]